MKNIEKNWLEWSVFSIGAILIVCTLVYLIYDVATIGQSPPTIEFRLGEIRASKQHFIIPVSVTNQGDETAENVQIEVILEKGGKELERAEFQIAFLPRGATREGWVTFQADPRTAEAVKARALGYEKP